MADLTQWIHQHLSILVLGPAGIGKTFLACTLAHVPCHHNFSVSYERTSRLLHQIPLAHANGS